MKWSLASVTILALSAGAAPVHAEQASPVGAAPPAVNMTPAVNRTPAVNMTGSWSWERGIRLESPSGLGFGGVPTCDLVQTGNRISGDCTLDYAGKGPVTGTVSGDQVVLKWHFIRYEFLLTRPVIGGAYDDRHADVTFRGSFDANHVFHGRYRSDNQPSWRRVFFARRDTPGPA